MASTTVEQCKYCSQRNLEWVFFCNLCLEKAEESMCEECKKYWRKIHKETRELGKGELCRLCLYVTIPKFHMYCNNCRQLYAVQDLIEIEPDKIFHCRWCMEELKT